MESISDTLSYNCLRLSKRGGNTSRGKPIEPQSTTWTRASEHETMLSDNGHRQQDSGSTPDGKSVQLS